MDLCRSAAQKKELRKAMLQAIGRLLDGVPLLKKLLLFTHLALAEMALVRQVRLLARRNRISRSFGMNVTSCTLGHIWCNLV